MGGSYLASTSVRSSTSDAEVEALRDYDTEQAARPRTSTRQRVGQTENIPRPGPNAPTLTIEELKRRSRELHGAMIYLKVNAIEEGYAFNEAGDLVAVRSRSNTPQIEDGRIPCRVKHGSTLSVLVYE